MLSNTIWREKTLQNRVSNMLKNGFFSNVLTRQILFDNTRLETLVCRVKVALEIIKRKRHCNSRQNFATEEESILNCQEILVASEKF